MNAYDFTTGYVSGVTRIPVKTIQEYISKFRDHFSTTAGQTKKGRRFLPADIDKLQTIKRLRAERIPDDEIKQILAGELPLKLAHQFREDEVKNMAAHSLEIFTQAENTIEKAEDTLAEARRMMREAQELQQQTRRENQAVRNEVQAVLREMQKFREWQLFVMKFDSTLNPYKQDDPAEPLAQQMPREKKRGLCRLG